MISSPERIAANRANAAKSTGPRTAEGKEASRANGYKHGLTGNGIVMAEAEAADLAEMTRRFRDEMRPLTEVGGVLVDRMALMAVRLKRCEAEESLRLAAMNDGEGGLIDFSTEGRHAFHYEQAASRAFFKAHAEFRKLQAEARDSLPPCRVAAPIAATPAPEVTSEPMASSFPPTFPDLSWIDEPAPPTWPTPTRTPSKAPRPKLPARR